ncbi:hypothetical protein PGB90_004001 [Kerria lacca]
MAIKNRRCNLLMCGVMFLQDNARSHTSHVTKELLKSFKWDVFPNPPHSPNLAPSDYHLFPHLKWYLGGTTFSNNDELQATVTEYFAI